LLNLLLCPAALLDRRLSLLGSKFLEFLSDLKLRYFEGFRRYHLEAAQWSEMFHEVFGFREKVAPIRLRVLLGLPKNSESSGQTVCHLSKVEKCSERGEERAAPACRPFVVG
jgi:hypothetical protein